MAAHRARRALARRAARRGLGRRPGAAARGRRDRDAGAPREARGRGAPPVRPAGLTPGRRPWYEDSDGHGTRPSAADRRQGHGDRHRALRRDRGGTLVAALPPPPPPDLRRAPRPGLEGRIEIVRDRWGMPTVRAQTPADLWYGQGFCHGQDRLWQCEVNRRVTAGRISEIAGRGRAAGRPADAHPGPAPRRAPRGDRARAGSPPAARRLLRRAQRGGADRLGASSRVPAPAPGLRALAAGRHAGRRQAALLRALDELGARAAPRRPRPRAGRGTCREDRSHLSEGQPGRAPSRTGIRRRRTAAGGADRPGPRADRPGDGGERLQQLGGDAGALGDRRRPARRRSAPAQRDAGCLVRGRAGARRPVLPRRLDPGAAGHLPRPEQRRRLRLHQRDGGRRGPLRRADRGRELRVRGRAAAARDHRGGDRGPGAGPVRAP